MSAGGSNGTRVPHRRNEHERVRGAEAAARSRRDGTYPRLIDQLDWPAGRLAAHRTRQLRGLVRAAAERSPWYSKRLADVDIDRLDETTLAGLPVLTKAELMEHFDNIVTDRRLSLAQPRAAPEDGGDRELPVRALHRDHVQRVHRPARRVRIRLGQLGGVLAEHVPRRAAGEAG